MNWPIVPGYPGESAVVVVVVVVVAVVVWLVAVKITCQWQSTIGTTKETTERNTMERKNREEEQRAVSIVVPK